LKKLEKEGSSISKKPKNQLFEIGESGGFQISSPTSEFLVVAMEKLGRVLPRRKVESLDLIIEETKKKGKNAILKEYHLWMKLKVDEFLKFEWKKGNLMWNEEKTKLVSFNPTISMKWMIWKFKETIVNEWKRGNKNEKAITIIDEFYKMNEMIWILKTTESTLDERKGEVSVETYNEWKKRKIGKVIKM
jgi:hypothetical protein